VTYNIDWYHIILLDAWQTVPSLYGTARQLSVKLSTLSFVRQSSYLSTMTQPQMTVCTLWGIKNTPKCVLP